MTFAINRIDFRAVGADVGAAPDVWLRAPVTIFGVEHSLDAIAVRPAVDGRQQAVCTILDDMLDCLAAAVVADGPFQTVRIRDRDYVLLLTPHS